MLGQTAQATILWAGGEDVDFPNGGVCRIGGGVRAGYARHSIATCNAALLPVSLPFSGGAVTSVWMSAYIWGADNVSHKYVGLTRSGTTSSLFVGTSASGMTKVALWKFDGTTWTELAAESTGTLVYDGSAKWDMQVIGYGASATVNIYINGSLTPRVTYTGNVLAGSATNLDSVILKGSGNWSSVSEIIVADSDTRKLSLVTLAPNAAGDANQWAGTYSNINVEANTDATTISDTTSGDIFRCNVSDLPSTSVQVLAVKVAARMTQTAPGIASAALGVKTNASVSVPSAAALPGVWGTIETFYLTNPITSGAWTPADVNALQINIQSAP